MESFVAGSNAYLLAFPLFASQVQLAGLFVFVAFFSQAFAFVAFDAGSCCLFDLLTDFSGGALGAIGVAAHAAVTNLAVV